MIPDASAGTPEPGFVSRGGLKLDGALGTLRLDVTGARALDAGASTGGFTDCLLRRGAAHVIAADVAYGLFAWRLRNDERVTVLERTNVRHLTLDKIGDPVDFVVADLAFISLRAVRDALLGVATADARLVLMVKPQFELPRNRVERGGVVRDPRDWRDAMLLVANAYREAGCGLEGAAASPLTGPKGNREFFVSLRRGAETDAGDAALDAAVESAP